MMYIPTITDNLFVKRKSPLKQKLVATFLIVMFFLPYFAGSPYRLDNVIGVIYITIFTALFIIKGRVKFHNIHEKILTIISFMIIIYLFMTLLPYLSFPLQHINYQLYLAVGMSIWCIHRNTLLSSRNLVIVVLLALSVPIFLLAIMQLYFKDSSLVHLMLSLYGGASSDEYDLEKFGIGDSSYNNMAGIQVLTGTAMTSIFSGKHSLAQYCLLVIAIGLGAYRDRYISKIGKILVLFSVPLAVTAGLLTTSKVFFFSLPIFPLIYVIASGGSLRVFKVFLQVGVGITITIILIAFLSPQLRVLNDLVYLVLSGDVLSIFNSRYGQDGYLTSFNEIFNYPMTWIVGVGAEAGAWKISDSQYRASILIGGLPYLVLFHSFIFYLLFLNWRLRKLSPYAVPFFALGISLLIAGIGIPVYWQARIIPIWVLANLLLIISYPRNIVLRSTTGIDRAVSKLKAG